MITYNTGDLLTSTAQTLTCTVNLVGVMGAGIALDMNKAYPGLLETYKRLCDDKTLQMGQLVTVPVRNEKQILLFPTKIHFKYPSTLAWIKQNLMCLSRYHESLGITSLAMPKLGCLNGKLKWSDVEPMIVHYLKDLPFDTELYVDARDLRSTRR